MKKYLHIIKMASMEQIVHYKSLFARILLLIIMLTIFNSFWTILYTEQQTTDISAVNFIWYLLLGAILQFGRPEGLHRRIEEDIRTGNIAYLMMRPVSFIGEKCCESIGTFLIRLPILLSIGSLTIYILTKGQLPSHITSLFQIIPLLFLSIILLSLGTIFVGLSALYLQDSLPLFWMIQKGEYILGGLFFPLTFYPKFLCQFAQITPFGAAGYNVTRFIYQDSTSHLGMTIGLLLFWIMMISFFNITIFYVLKRRVSINGG